MDDLDLRLIHALQVRTRIPWTTLAAVLHVDAATLLRRWRRLVDHGFVYTTAMTASGAAKLQLSLIEIKCRPTDLLSLSDELSQVPGLISIDLTATGRNLIVSAVGSSLDAITAWTMRMSKVAAISGMQTQHVCELVAEASAWRPRSLSQAEELAVRAWNPPGRLSDKLSWSERTDLVEALSQDVRAPITELAARTGLSNSRVSEALAAMTNSGDLIIRVDLARRLSPHPIYPYYFLQAPPSTLAEVARQLSRLPEMRLVARVVGSCNLIASFWLKSLADVQRLDEALETRLRNVTVVDRTLVTKSVKHMGYLMDDSGLATRGRVRVLPI